VLGIKPKSSSTLSYSTTEQLHPALTGFFERAIKSFGKKTVKYIKGCERFLVRPRMQAAN
jgi:hypothetical protein